ncbi:MAG: thioesterase family protein [Ectothiorhodospiraceae bacterium]|jgi:acyl-CoA thioester hydrolase
MERAGALPLTRTEVQPEWLDYNHHMNDAAYAVLFSRGIDVLMDLIGLDSDGRARHSRTLYTLDMHLRYARECREGDPLNVEMQLLDWDAKRLHLMMGAWVDEHDAPLAATAEIMLMCIDSDAIRGAAFPVTVSERIADLWGAHQDLPRPAELDRGIGIRRD